jgi:Zinc finger, C3HC4 type (RING finger)
MTTTVTTSRSNHGPVPLRPAEVPADLTCAICLSIPLEPVLTRLCEHLFCKDCLHTSLRTQPLPTCPVDRLPFFLDEIQEINKDGGGLIYRIWSSVTVMCEEHNAGCSWTGSIADYAKHGREDCKRQQSTSLVSIQELKARLVKCEVTMDMLLYELSEFKEERNCLKIKLSQCLKTRDWYIKRLKMAKKAQESPDSIKELEARLVKREVEKDMLLYDLNERKKERSRLKIKLSQCLKTQDLYIERLKMAETTRESVVSTLFRAGGDENAYKYDRNNVVELSQLISRHLENKPDEIDANRIFNCVRSCVADLQKDWSDNPEHYHTDMRMLLATCSASTWFSPKQRQKFLNWMAGQAWTKQP